MFIKKITGIKAVGRFRVGGISGGEYAKFTLFYAGNGRGKTTICAVLRSLQTNNPKHILKRRTFRSASSPEVQLLLDSGPLKFSGGTWDRTVPDLHIFDQHFINANVHGGHQIDIDHRRNFYRVVVGPKGVKLAEEIDALDTAAAAKQQEITNEKKVLQQHVPKGMTLEAFVALTADGDIDTKIDGADKALKAIDASVEIAARSKLKQVELPALPPEFEALMARGLPDIAADAAALVQAQLAKHDFHDGGEAWLATGLAHVQADACPFCSASVADNPLILSYQGYFSEAYEAHKAALEDLRKQLETALGTASALTAQQNFKDAARDAEFWSQYADHGYVGPPETETIVAKVGAFYAAAAARLSSKIATP